MALLAHVGGFFPPGKGKKKNPQKNNFYILSFFGAFSEKNSLHDSGFLKPFASKILALLAQGVCFFSPGEKKKFKNPQKNFFFWEFLGGVLKGWGKKNFFSGFRRPFLKTPNFLRGFLGKHGGVFPPGK